MFGPRQRADEMLQHQLKTVQRLGRSKCWGRRLLADDLLDFWNYLGKHTPLCP
jgi:hypothetical protein